MEPSTEPHMPAVKSRYTFLERVIFTRDLLDLYLLAMLGESVQVSDDLVHWFYWEMHDNHGACPVINETIAQFVADHSDGPEQEG